MPLIELTDEELFLIKKWHQNHINLCKDAIEYKESTLKYSRAYAEAWLPVHQNILKKLENPERNEAINKIEVLGKAENNVQNDRTIFQIASSTKPTELIVIHNGHKVLLNDKEV